MRLRTALCAAILGTLAGVVLSPSPLPPCPTEDSVGCHWDAERQGNGQGRSFIVEQDGTVVYLVRGR